MLALAVSASEPSPGLVAGHPVAGWKSPFDGKWPAPVACSFAGRYEWLCGRLLHAYGAAD